MLSSTFSLTRALRVLAPLAVAVTALGILTPSPKAAAGPLSLAPITWDVIGLDSNNVDTGPNVFPVGVRICNTGSDPATNVQASWSWKTSQNSFETPTQGATVPVGTLAGSACRQAFFDVTLNRSASSRGKARDYQITVTADGGLNVAGPQRQLYVEKLVSQARNTTKKLAGPGGCNLAYTVCDPAPTNLIVGQTYTYKFYAETSTAYKQLETFVNWPAAIVQAVDSSSTYSNPSGATASSIYADACGWSPTTRSCVGPANIAGGKAGGRIVVTYRVTPVAPGSGSLKSTIYDFSGSSYHYNTDYATAALLTSSLNVRYGIVATVTGNGKVTSSLAGTLADGTSSGLDCGVTCEVGHTSGATVTLTAVPQGADTFVGWSGGSCTGASLTCTVTMSQSRTVTAAFTGVTSFPLTVSKVGSGTVNASSGSLACGATCTALYADGASVTLTATPSAGYVFDGWTGEGCSSTGTCTVTMSQARSVTASFTEQTFMLSVATTGNGTVSANLGTISCGNGSTFCSDVYGSGTNVTLTAAAGTNQSFTGWSGACTGTSPTCAVTMTEARSVTAAFSGTTVYTLDVGLSGSGTGTVTSSPAGINCGATCSATYANGTNVTLTASAASGSSFVGWSGDCTGSGATCTVTMSQARDVAAIFGVNYTLLVARDGTGTGTVTSSPNGVNCGATCSASYGDGAVVTLTPTPSAGSIFTGWNGACTGTGTCTVTMDAAKSVTATFTTAFVLSVTKSGSGVGTVASSGDEILCGATCSATFPAGTVVTLAATAATGSRFTGWSGACSGTGSCTVTMSQARSVTATFVPVFTLSVSRGGAGSGMVTGSGIDCGSTCDLDYDSGTSVTLTATAAAGSRFTGWSGACSGTGSCTVTVSQARSVTATFVPVFTLTVTKSGAGSGTVTGSGITCGNTCALDYDSATSVTLTATAAAGSRFTGWSGACSGTGSCTVTMSQARSVTATFVRLFTLTVITSGSGSVTGSGIDCGSTCTVDYDDGTSVTLTATAAAGSRFTGWSGDCSGTGTCTVTMAQARSVTATFVPLFTLTVTTSGAGSGTVTGSGITCGSTCDLDYDSGTSVTLTATAATGSRFTGWSGD
ncbi:MAG TPA: hypothetical protein VEY87_11110, partial [Gaiellaceae bacterium]|nr:hypothetical protein [Gaiellaceae bacterium]